MISKYTELGADPYVLWSYKGQKGQELTLYDRPFDPQINSSLPQIESADHFATLVNQALDSLPN